MVVLRFVVSARIHPSSAAVYPGGVIKDSIMMTMSYIGSARLAMVA